MQQYISSIKIKSLDVKLSTYIGFNKENNEEDLKFEVGDHIRISIYKNIFAKDYAPTWPQEVFVITKV